MNDNQNHNRDHKTAVQPNPSQQNPADNTRSDQKPGENAPATDQPDKRAAPGSHGDKLSKKLAANDQ